MNPTEREEGTLAEKEAQPSSREIARLEESFRVFTRTTRDLEASYRNLTRRAERIDLELRRTNSELEQKVALTESLASSRAAVLDALPDGVVVVDAAGCVACINPAAERLLGRRAEELVGRSREAIVGPSGDRLLAPASAPGSAHSHEREILALDGSRRRIGYTVITLDDGSEMQVLADRTVVTRLREQVGRLDTLAALGEMAAGVAHEIRNPLNGIDGFAGLLERALERGDETVDAGRYLANIRRGVREVNAIVDNLLTYASPESLRATLVDLVTVLEKSIESARECQAGARRIRLRRDDAPGPCELPADAIRLGIVFGNLIRNAIEATPEDGTIEVTLRRDAETLLVLVTDNGCGLPAEMRERLYRPFSTTKARGTGLGLAIAHKFVSLHGGEIEWRPTKRGCCFAVTLPAFAGEAGNP